MNIPTTSTMYTPSMLIIPIRFRDSAERKVGSRQLENSLLPGLVPKGKTEQSSGSVS